MAIVEIRKHSKTNLVEGYNFYILETGPDWAELMSESDVSCDSNLDFCLPFSENTNGYQRSRSWRISQVYPSFETVREIPTINLGGTFTVPREFSFTMLTLPIRCQGTAPSGRIIRATYFPFFPKNPDLANWSTHGAWFEEFALTSECDLYHKHYIGAQRNKQYGKMMLWSRKHGEFAYVSKAEWKGPLGWAPRRRKIRP